MTWLKMFLSRFLALFRKPELEEELDTEVRFHLEMETAENLRRGMTPEEARYAALRQFGGVDQAKESWRDRCWLPQVDQWVRDLRFGARSLARSPGFVTFAVLSLALGIGLNTAIFTMLRALVLQPLPYPEPWGLVKVYESMIWQGQSTYGSGVSVPNLEDWREQNRVFEDLAGFAYEGANLTHQDGAMRLMAAEVEPGVFPIMRIPPLVGRTFLPEENVPGADRVVVLSHGLWERSFGADRGIVGQKLSINGAAHTVVGVMPPGFRFPPRSAAELWTPLAFSERMRTDRGSHWVQVIARLKPGVSWVAAQLDMSEIARRLEKQHPDTNATRGVGVFPLHAETVRAMAQVLMVLAGAVGFVLLLACANVAHMVLARAVGRRRELSVRMALGAGRWRIVRLLTLESVLLAAAGGVAGYFGGRWCLDALLAFTRDQLPAGVVVTPDTTTIWFCVLASLISALLAGLIPALRVSRVDLQSALKEAGSSAGTALRRNRSVLMVWEVALALVLAVGALLLMRSLRLLNNFDLGFQPERVLTMKLELPGTRYPKREEAVAFYDRLLEQVRAVPGVSSAGAINFLPVQFSGNASLSFTIQGRDASPPGHEPSAEHRLVTPGYFQTMGIPLVAGRYLTEEDRVSGQRVVVLSRQTAERYFPNENPVGRSIRYITKVWEADWLTVVGVVGDVRTSGVYRPTPTVIYVPYGQSEWPWSSTSLVLRSQLEPAQLAATVRRLVREKDPDAAVLLVKTMESVVSDSVAGTRFLSRLFTIFSALALVLAVVGVYGVMSHLVSQRTHEIGVRMALGASRGEVLRLVLARGLRNALTGTLLGLGCTVMASFAMRHFLIGIGVVDFWTYLTAASGIIAVAVVASYVPAWRASRVDPLVALRDE
jgi:putative ABC transport system permease protein